MSTTARSTSDLIEEIIQSSEKNDRISIGEFVDLLGARGFSLVVLIFALPNSLPVPGIPGFSTITGFPIMLIGLQMFLGRDFLWLPKSIGNKTFSRKSLAGMLKKALPFVQKLERRILTPRLLWMDSRFVHRLMGLIFMFLAGIISLPIPGGNFLPGLSMSLIAITILQRDGLCMLIALVFAAVSSYFMFAIIEEFIRWAADVLQNLF